MPRFHEYQLSAQNVKSIQWHNQQLIDWVSGGVIYQLDGHVELPHSTYAEQFDAAIISPSGIYVVLYERLGTKGIVLHQGRIIRTLNRSLYHAHAYEYPIAFIKLDDGHELLVHCPDQYCRLEFEEIATGERLTTRDHHTPADIFFSRLTSSLSHRFLLMAGWVWHPWDVIGVYDIRRVLADPTLLDGSGEAPRTSAEIYAAAFSDDRMLVLITSDETNSEGDANEDDPLWQSGPQSIAYYDMLTHEYHSIVRAQETVGKILPVGSRYLIGFYDHPKLFDRMTGTVVHRWPELATGKQTSSIQWRVGPVPPVALDGMNKRFAVAGTHSITVIEIAVDE